MKYLGGFLLTFAAIYGLYVLLPGAKNVHGMTHQELIFGFEKLDQEVSMRDRTMTTPEGGVEMLNKMRDDRSWMALEIKRRSFHTDYVMAGAGLLGLLLILISNFTAQLKIEKAEKMSAPKIAQVDMAEAPPREEYVDPFEFERRSEGGFRTRDEAIQWMLKDPLLTCDYCGSSLRSTYSGNREALELVTFYKKVPDGAKDMRIILGSFWFGKAASELKCTGCQRVVRR